MRAPLSPITHFLAGWAVAQAAQLKARERAAVAIAGVIPDIDGLGVVVDFVTRNSAAPTNWWGEYHHILGHGLLFCALCAAGGWVLAERRWLTALLITLSFHLHLLGDLIGARGPEGEQWPIHYLWPFSEYGQWTWQGQWALNAWPNFVITGVLLLLTFYWARIRGYSPLEIFSKKADAAFVATLRHRFPVRAAS